MSAIRLTAPSRQMAPARAQLRSVSLASSRAASPRNKIVTMLTIGALGIAIANLVLHILTSTAVYELASLQQQARELNTTSQIIADEVDSLSSQQNLSNSAQKLGMIANANPVFLSIEEQKVFGKPKSALNTDGRVAKNNIASAALIQESVLTPAVADTAISTDVAKSVTTVKQVTLPATTIPASPTH